MKEMKVMVRAKHYRHLTLKPARAQNTCISNRVFKGPLIVGTSSNGLFITIGLERLSIPSDFVYRYPVPIKSTAKSRDAREDTFAYEEP